jgi:hypothetical protein
MKRRLRGSTLSRFSPGRDIGSMYAKHFSDPVQERRLLSTLGFYAAFATARTVTHAIRDGVGPFGNLSAGGRHIHHMTFGIVGMLATGTMWVNQFGDGHHPDHRRASRVTSALFGAGAALTLDEFALWLNLEDDYWTKQGRESIDAVALYGSLLLAAMYGRDMIAEIARVPGMDSRQRRRARARRLIRYQPQKALTLARNPRLLRDLVL